MQKGAAGGDGTGEESGGGGQPRQNVYGNAIIIPITLCANLSGRGGMHEVQERLSHIDFCGRPTRGNPLTHA